MLSDLDEQIERPKRCEPLRESEVKALCLKAMEILVEESNVQRVDAPVTRCGDIHRQFYEMKELFMVGGKCPKANYLFLGDFVDQGFYFVEMFLLLLALKVMRPSSRLIGVTYSIFTLPALKNIQKAPDNSGLRQGGQGRCSLQC